MRFLAIDLETANPRMSSICQVGVVVFEDGRETASDVVLVDPQDYFDPFNVGIHGIDERRVAGAKAFPQVHDWICDWTRDEIVVCHTHFDRVALAQACGHHSLAVPTCQWLDSARVARRAWPQYAQGGYGLANLARDFEISFQHHDALEDARTAGLILVKAIAESGTTAAEWIRRLSLATSREAVRRQGDGDGPLVGERAVFTGSLAITRREAADLAHAAGCAVEPGVTKHTTLLVVGDQDLDKLGGKDRSAKHLKAEQLIAKGQRIRILGERDFMAIVA